MMRAMVKAMPAEAMLMTMLWSIPRHIYGFVINVIYGIMLRCGMPARVLFSNKETKMIAINGSITSVYNITIYIRMLHLYCAFESGGSTVFLFVFMGVCCDLRNTKAMRSVMVI